MRYAKILIIILISLNYSAKAQICNFCSQEQLKELLDLNEIEYTQKLDNKNEKIFFFSTKNYVKRWYFKYDKCYMYEITITNKSKLKSLVHMVDKIFNKIDEDSWEDLDNRVELITINDNPTMQFIPKLSYDNINNSNNNCNNN
jgi:hypothetical protein